MTDTPSLPADRIHRLSDWELWACAKQQIGRYGDDAAEHAALRADALLAQGDLAGHRVWLDILSRIRQLTIVTPRDRPN